MIPCPVCLMELDGHGGRCRTHESWRTFRVWLAGDWPALEDLVDQAGPGPGHSERLAEAMAANRMRLRLLADRAIVAEQTARQIKPFVAGAYVGFRHFRDSYDRPRGAYAAAVERVVLPVLDHLQLVEADQVDGLAHLFYDLNLEPPGPDAPRTAGVQLVISDRIA